MQVDKFTVEAFPDLNEYAGYESDNKLRVCIATEEILGPVRNGGIASTYYHLAKGLAAHGHDVHVLYLKGQNVENETPEHWVEHFSSFGVTLHYLAHTTEIVIGPSQGWQRRYSAAYRWLVEQERFNVVHSSEWRGGLIYALMAKKLGLAFQDTLFIIKTSSPHLWNRHYQMQTIAKRELLPASFAEQKCVELGDMIIGGSAHLLCFMRYVGYKLPRATYVQPNILDFSEVLVNDQRDNRKPGDLIHTQELTFFGRLEMRKGIELFCAALDLLQRSGKTPNRVNFLGKYGEALPNQNNEKVADYLERKALNWSFEVNYITDCNQPEALSFLCSRDMIAVMPSLIENSTMAVYETLENNIPFIATRVGGTPELIAEKDQDDCLIAPYAYDLAKRLQKVLENGHTVAHSSFDNQRNLQVWYGFHAYIADLFSQLEGSEVVSKVTGQLSSDSKSKSEIAEIKLEVVVVLRDVEGVTAFAEALALDPPDSVKILIIDPMTEETALQACNYLQGAGLDSHLVDFIGFPAGVALNRSLSESTLDACILCDGTASRFIAGFCSELRKALRLNQENLITSFLSLPDNKVVMPMGSDIVSEITFGNSIGTNVVCIPRSISRRVGSLLPYDIRYGLLQEYILRANKEFGLELMVIPECHLESDTYLEELEEYQSNANSAYLRSMPLIENDNLAYRKLALLPTSVTSASKVKAALYRDKHRLEDEPVWLVHADRPRKMKNRNPRVVVGLDERNSHLLCVANGQGKRQLIVNGEPQPISLEQHDNELTLHRFPIPDSWEEGERFNIKFLLEDQAVSYTRFIRVIKLSKNVFAAISGSPILNDLAIEDIFKQKSNWQFFSKTELSTSTDDISIEEMGNGIQGVEYLIQEEEIKAEHVTNSSALEESSESEHDLAQMIYEQNKVHENEAKPLFRFQALVQKSGTTLQRLIRGYTGSPIKGSIPPRELFSIDPRFIEGWAWDRSNITRNLVVVLELNGIIIAEATANRYVERFGTRNPKLSWYGFRFSLTPEIKKENSEFIIRVKENGLIIRNGRLRYLKQMLVAI
ncbi:glycosyltransferase family 4 protein [Microbulbifer sp. OS29]|uniref:Glycosyltransferase family 4 protein n=1 Tax=Microbulbifer okhotskensis TaxID=2926617 RepID=A0A9X2J5L3_9GAMM|nr:glycosyltransferase family 4 protein [Microbulbifer okhotskensis]MCO1335323.1 glycosyltransferase family 4 protein [Microbulbifer okhotskensis]